MRNTSIQPRSVVHRGHVQASGFFFDADFYDEAGAKRRILEHWESGARVYALEAGLLLRFSSPRSVRAETAIGAVVTERAGCYLTAPLSEREWRALEAEISGLAAPASSPTAASRSGAQSVVLVREGKLVVAEDAPLIDPGDWLDCSGWTLQPLKPLGQPAPVALQVPIVPSARKSLEVPESQELKRFLELMNQLGDQQLDQEPPGQKLRSFFKTLLRSRGGSGSHDNSSTESQPGGWRGILDRLSSGRNGENQASDGKREGILAGFLKKFSLNRLFLFRFGAVDDAPQLRPRQRFSSEFGILLPTLFWLGVIGLLWSQFGSGTKTEIPWGTVLLWLISGGLIAWVLLVVARFFPVPSFLTRQSQSLPPLDSRSGGGIGIAGFSFDLAGLVLVGVVLVLEWKAANWGALLFWLFVAFLLALATHWWRRRSDPQGRDAGEGGASARLMQLLARMGSRLAGAGAAGRAGKQVPGGVAPKPRLSVFNRWLWNTELGRIMGARQARYVMRMMQMFEQGDLDAALRHAVPLNLFGESSGNLALGTPGPRRNLDFAGPKISGGAAIPLPDHVQKKLTEYYRGAFNQLEAAARIDEAAFVLAELLDSPLEAVQYLEKHRQWAKAAQLSEARELEAGLTVRLWWLAGQRQRAVVVAQRSNAFADAISRLEKSGEQGGETIVLLRLLWGQSLALAGDFAVAVEVVWPVVPSVPQARGFVGAWIERGLEGSGVGAAKMLAKQASLLDSLSAPAVQHWRERVEQLLADPDEEAIRLRLALASGLRSSAASPLAQVAARRTVRALARDAVRFPAWSHALQEESKRLVEYAGDGPLRVDSAALKFPAPPPTFHSLRTRIELSLGWDDVGALEISDAAWLPDGRVLVALGESGARLLNREGRTIATFDQPCHRLVLASDGERAIGVALRGLTLRNSLSGAGVNLAEELGRGELSRRAEGARLCRFDLTRKTAQFWGEAQIGQFLPHTTGMQWLVTSGDSIVSIDVTAPHPTALWSTGNAGYAECIAANDDSLAMVTHFSEARQRPRSEVWRFELPSLTLRERRLEPDDLTPEDRAKAPVDQPRLPRFIAPDGTILLGEAGRSPQCLTRQDKENKLFKIFSPSFDGDVQLQIESNALWLVSLRRSREGVVFRFWSRNQETVLRGKLEMAGGRRARFRLTESHLVAVDDLGRLVVLDLSTGAVVRNLRLF